MAALEVLALVGSLRAGALSRGLALAAAAAAPDGVRVTLHDGLGALPLYAEDVEGDAPAAVEDLRAAIGRADALLVVTPEHNGTIPAALKNAIDWASRPRGTAELVGTPAAVVSHSPSPFGGAWAASDLRRALGIAGARVVEDGASIGRSHERVSPAGETLDEGLADDLAGVLARLGAAVAEGAVAA